MTAPRLTDVLVHVRPGRTVRLYLTDEQKHALADRDGQTAQRVIRALLQARRHATDPNTPAYSFPLTEDCFQAIALKLGRPISDKRARAIRRRCIECGLLIPSGDYRSRYRVTGDGGGHLVTLYTLGARIIGLRSALCRKPAVGGCEPVKVVRVRRCWEHALFGTFDGLPPPQLTRRQRRMWRSADERMGTWR